MVVALSVSGGHASLSHLSVREGMAGSSSPILRLKRSSLFRFSISHCKQQFEHTTAAFRHTHVLKPASCVY